MTKLIGYVIGGGLIFIMFLWIYAMMKIARISDERMAMMTNTCPECGGKLIHEGGCLICKNCGFSPCH